jgi:hypothetical protein
MAQEGRSTMPSESLETRVATLDAQVMELRELPAQVAELASQIVLLRTEMHSAASATRAQAAAGHEETRRVLREEFQANGEAIVRSLRQEIRAGDEAIVRSLRQEIRAGDDETRTLMRVLHEDLVGRIALLQEHYSAPDTTRQGNKPKAAPAKRRR